MLLMELTCLARSSLLSVRLRSMAMVIRSKFTVATMPAVNATKPIVHAGMRNRMTRKTPVAPATPTQAARVYENRMPVTNRASRKTAAPRRVRE